MRKCVKCNIEKPLSDFNKRGSGLKNSCRECEKLYYQKWYKNNKEAHIKRVYIHREKRQEASRKFIVDYLSIHSCVDCGETEILLLDFDHIRGEKKYSISEMVHHGISVPSIEKEIEKCDVRCVSCHRRKTASENGWWKVLRK